MGIMPLKPKTEEASSSPVKLHGDAGRFPYFHPAVAAWFSGTFGEPSPPQALGWPAIAAGENVLIIAPTGSGKTLAAFLQCLSWLYTEAQANRRIDDGVRVLYISPLRALNNDVHRNLEVPLEGINATAKRMGFRLPRLSASVRTGDTPVKERSAIVRHPPQILITTPESLFLMLCSKARSIFKTVRFVILDEIHSLFPTKRGAHLSLTLEYLEEIAARPFTRIGLSATARPVGEIAAFLGGGMLADGADGLPGGEPVWVPRSVRIIDTGQRKGLDLLVQTPVDDLRELPEKTIWPEIYKHLWKLVLEHRSTLIFVNNRQVAERVAAHLNELAGEETVRVHHGSMSREMRLEVEELLKAGKLRAVVATSSLELGIDIGSIDLVIQVESPHEVARGLQRVGRAGHLLGLPSKGRIVVKNRADLLEAACIAREMGGGRIEEMHAPENCLDVLAQAIVGFAVEGPMPEEALFGLVRRAYGYRDLPRRDFEAVLHMLSGGEGSEEFSDLRPVILREAQEGIVKANERGKRLVYANAGTIPDRGYYGVYTESRVRIGEVDEEFVYERRVGDRFPLGINVWQIKEINHDRVIVSPTSRRPTVLPFWRGEGFGRPYELGLTLGKFLEEAYSRLDDPDFESWLIRECFLEGAAARNLRDYLDAQRKATGVLPSHRRILIEEFRDELGEWRVAVHSLFGGRVNGPLAMLLADSLERKTGLKLEFMRNDDGILFLCPAAEEPLHIDLLSVACMDWETTRARLEELLRDAPLFGLLFRHAAARALILPRGTYGRRRTPLWLSRLKAADLMGVVDGYQDFPITLEAYREALGEVLDMGGLRQVLEGIRSGAIEIVRHRRRVPSPFAWPLMFGFMSAYLYGQDMPKRRARRDPLVTGGRAPGALSGGEARRGETEECHATGRRVQAFEPRGAEDFAAFLARWQGIDSPGSGPYAVARALRQLSYHFFPVALWEGAILPARVRDYEPAFLDRAIGSGEFRWIANGEPGGIIRSVAMYPSEMGPGPLKPRDPDPGQRDGIFPAPVRLIRRDRENLKALLGILREKGALFLPELWRYTGLLAHEFLMTLAMATCLGEITNDSFEPVRCFAAGRGHAMRDPSAHNPQRLPPELLQGCGRWSLIQDGPGGGAGGDSELELLCWRILERYGIATRELILGSNVVALDWDEAESVFRKWEALGRVRRGYFVKGLSGVQYALPEALEGLMLPREAGARKFWALAVGDPANPWRTLFQWPGREDMRLRGPHTTVLRSGTPVLTAQGDEVKIMPLVPLGDEELALALGELVKLLEWRFRSDLRIEIIAYDGKPITSTPAYDILRGLGFERGYQGMVRWLWSQ